MYSTEPTAKKIIQMTKRKVLDLLPLLILIGALVYSFAYFNFRIDQFPFPFVAGLVLTILTTLTYFFWKKGFKTVLGIALILGSINLVKFLPLYVTFGGGLTFSAFDTGFLISIQLFSFVVLLIFTYINWQRIKQIIGDIIKDKPLTDVEVIEQREKKIERFKLQFKDRSINEITTISRSDTFDKEAIEAAKRLLVEKNAR
jgi:hypothetical protein